MTGETVQVAMNLLRAMHKCVQLRGLSATGILCDEFMLGLAIATSDLGRCPNKEEFEVLIKVMESRLLASLSAESQN